MSLVIHLLVVPNARFIPEGLHMDSIIHAAGKCDPEAECRVEAFVQWLTVKVKKRT